jgi:hypothetical protein
MTAAFSVAMGTIFRPGIPEIATILAITLASLYGMRSAVASKRSFGTEASKRAFLERI